MSTATTSSILTTEDHGEVTIVRFTKIDLNIDEFVAQIMEAKFADLVASSRYKILVSFENVNYVSAEGIGKLIKLCNSLQGKTGKLVLCAVNEVIYPVFELVDLVTILNVTPTEEEALQLF